MSNSTVSEKPIAADVSEEPKPVSIERAVADMLSRLAGLQEALLNLLVRKQALLRETDVDGLLAIHPEEEKIIRELEEVHSQRGELLEQAAGEGLPSDSIRSLTGAMPQVNRGEMGEQVKQVSAKARLLQHHGLTNWVVTQRTLIHLSQMLEIIATGGRIRPTYGNGEPTNASGSLVDQEA